jgi:molybdopterin/thiamine biosynthesis adenylyltransferase
MCQHRIVLWAETLLKHRDEKVCVPLRFHRWDDGTCYTQVNVGDTAFGVCGFLHTACGHIPADVSGVAAENVMVHVFAGWERAAPSRPPDAQCDSADQAVRGFVKQEGQWKEARVQVVPVKEDLFSRSKGLFETNVLADVCVLIVGVGSVGAPLAEELAKLGIGRFILIDHDRIELVNVIRHVAGISDIGRYKTKVMADRIRNKNPHAEVETYEIKIARENQEMLRGLARRCDVGVGSLDDQEGRLIFNKVCVDENTQLIIPGVSRRAHSCQILFVRKPRVTPCYNCFLTILPQIESDREISSPEQAQKFAYSDRPVPIEPGLSIDIAPVVTMSAKLIVTELLKNKPTTMRSLEEDLIAPLWMYLNRREIGTEFEKLEPLGFNVGDGPHILSWWGIDLERNPACPTCGDFVGEMARMYGVAGNAPTFFATKVADDVRK